MKTIVKSACPPNLAKYRDSFPYESWDNMRNDSRNGGDVAYKETKKNLIEDQKGLCAYCECKLDKDASYTIRVEHFHPKSDTLSGYNWHTDWQNLLASCMGGEREGNIFQLPKNLSCDAHKKNKICDNTIVNPLKLPPFPAAFGYNMGTGELFPNPEFCDAYPKIPYNESLNTKDLLLNTLEVLNLNCDRLCSARLRVSKYLEQTKKKLRENHAKASIALPRLVKRYFANPWPEYFTVLRYCLAPYADNYLRSINYKG
ncbi:MAG: TIGR02646 family protein [Desulfovibrionaceae bacterium]|nr:TIGR02646 family protein [Desulfovibrionaceae bacterium]